MVSVFLPVLYFSGDPSPKMPFKKRASPVSVVKVHVSTAILKKFYSKKSKFDKRLFLKCVHKRNLVLIAK